LLSQAGCEEAARPVQEPQRVVSASDKPAAVTEQKAPEPVEPKPVRDRTRPAPDKPKPVRDRTRPAPDKPKPVPDRTRPARNKPKPAPDRTRPAHGKPKPDPSAPAPRIRFDKVVHNFGEVGPETNNICEFGFSNVGDAVLRIIDVKGDCGCLVFTLKKKEYAPGEGGKLKIKYYAGARAITTAKYIKVTTNDKAKPQVTLTIRAKIVPRVGFEPKRLNLLLKDDQESLPKITLSSLDAKAFSITSIISTANAVTADFDSAVAATKFVLQLEVDTAKLRRVSSGVIEVRLTHPECKKVSITFSALVRFKVNPAVIIAFDAEPGKKIERNVWVLNNYGEQFEVTSAKSSQGIMKVLSQEKIGSGYKFVVEITPPERGGKMKFMDEFLVQVKGGELLKTTCQGFYSRKKATTR